MTRDREQGVLEANAAFYAAFASRDVGAMDAVWARTIGVTCVHPGWNRLVGREAVMRSWAGILANPGSPRIECVQATVHAIGDVAYVVCHERVADGRGRHEPATLIATNVFVREGSDWRMVHHQAGPLAAGAPEAASLSAEDEEDDEIDGSEGGGGSGGLLN